LQPLFLQSFVENRDRIRIFQADIPLFYPAMGSFGLNHNPVGFRRVSGGPRRTGVTFLERKVTKGTFAETSFPFEGWGIVLKHTEISQEFRPEIRQRKKEEADTLIV